MFFYVNFYKRDSVFGLMVEVEKVVEEILAGLPKNVSGICLFGSSSRVCGYVHRRLESTLEVPVYLGNNDNGFYSVNLDFLVRNHIG